MSAPAKLNPVKMPSVVLPTHRQKGFTLIEALVAFLILSIGMLGVASLQLISVKAGQSAAFRMVAVTKVEDMFERIRNNPTQVLSYATGAPGPLDNGCNDYSGSVSSCSSANLVAYDKYEWQQELAVSLALPTVSTTTQVTLIDINTSPLFQVIITINWSERDPDAQGMVPMSYSASADICGTTAC